jgi:hypothetical protein
MFESSEQGPVEEVVGPVEEGAGPAMGTVEQAVEALASALAALHATDPTTLAGDELGEVLLMLGRHRSALEAAEAKVAAAFDAALGWAPSGARSAAAWWATEGRLPACEAGARLRRGRALRVCPEVAAAWSAGAIDTTHVKRLFALRSPRTTAAFARHEAALVGEARTLGYDAFDSVCRYWAMHADPDGAERGAADDVGARRVSLDQTLGGTYVGGIVLDPLAGATVAGELTRLEEALFAADRAEARDLLGRDPAPGELGRTRAQRMADALVGPASERLARP